MQSHIDQRLITIADQVNLIQTTFNKNMYQMDIRLKVIESSYHSTPTEEQFGLTCDISILTNIQCSLE